MEISKILLSFLVILHGKLYTKKCTGYEKKLIFQECIFCKFLVKVHMDKDLIPQPSLHLL